MKVEELKKYVSEFGFITLRATKADNIVKKNWIKRYDLNDDFDEFDAFDIAIFTDKYKFRAEFCAPGIGLAYNNNAKTKEILMECIEKDLKEGYILIDKGE